jgi:carbamoyltransferase
MSVFRTLGINLGHDSSICILDEAGAISFAIAEERLNREKSFIGWPTLALSMVEPGKYHIAIAQTESTFQLMEERYYRFLFNEGIEHYDLFNKKNSAMIFGSRKKIDVRPVIIEKLKKLGIEVVSISYFDHHRCHAASAYFTSGFKEALVLTADGAGDGRSATASVISPHGWEEISSTRLPDSPGHMYSWATRFLGYKVSRHEGKITGLAAHGDAEKLKKLSGKLLRYDAERRSFVNPYLANVSHPRVLDRLRCFLKGEVFHSSYEAFRRELLSKCGDDELFSANVAALAQHELECAIVSWVGHMIEHTGLSQVALAGGVFANVKLNQKIAEIADIKNLWIFPDMGDGGLSVGAAYLKRAANAPIGPNSLESVCLGPEFSDEAIISACDQANLTFRKSGNLPQEVASLLSRNLIIGWFQGRMEFGPRALGHRSILLTPSRHEMNHIVNSRLNRTEFMPFAPSVLSEYIEPLFYNTSKTRGASKFMTVTYDVRPEWSARLPGVVHVDHTARPQVVYRESEPLYWAVIDEFRKITGLPAIVNTSFNMHEEPIVCSPSDAIRSFLSGAVDVLVLGQFIIAKDSLCDGEI